MNIDVVDGQCEKCGLFFEPKNLYVDLVMASWCLKCQRCFYKDNASDLDSYYKKAKSVIPEVYSRKEYDKHCLDYTAIGDSLVYTGPEITDAALKNKIGNELARDYFTSSKISSKFHIINSQYSFAENKTEEGEKVILLMLKAKVQFKSYLEYLEHEMYKAFRKECTAIFD